ncbi:MAG: hypothetical protein JW772_02650, partial [Candidatus Diapherotrites archaeon]|nr:hypothetical protein [Candidatus Diapherotrites archaeon]
MPERKIRCHYMVCKNPKANFVYFQSLRGTEKEFSLLKNELKKKCNVYFFDFDYADFSQQKNVIMGVCEKLRREKIPLVVSGLSIGGAYAMIIGKEIGADFVFPVNSFYSKSMLFKERGRKDWAQDLKPFEAVKFLRHVEFVCSKNDSKISFEHSLKLFAEASGKKCIHILGRGGHTLKSKESQM